MAGPAKLIGLRLQNAWATLTAFVRVGPHDVVGHAVIHAVILGFPAATAIKTIVTCLMLADAWAFESMPIPQPPVHETFGLESLPIRPGAKHHDPFVFKSIHGL